MKSGHDAHDTTPVQAVDEVTLRLYVTMGTPSSSRAIANTRRLCEQHLSGRRYRLDVYNIADHIERATADEVIASPTLVRASPLPKRRFIGDLSNSPGIASALGASPAPGEPAAEKT
jgi:circadian clock protein KaiB